MNSAELLARHQAAAGFRPFASSLTALPLMVRPGATRDIQMSVHVVTTGPEPGSWLVALDGGVCRVMLGSIPEPDARLYTDSETGHSILKGELSIDEALTSRLLDFDGDPRELRRFGACFELGEGK